jgi:hypothetical protein
LKVEKCFGFQVPGFEFWVLKGTGEGTGEGTDKFNDSTITQLFNDSTVQQFNSSTKPVDLRLINN